MTPKHMIVLNLTSPLSLLFSSMQRQKVLNSYPSEFALVKRFWKYILDREVKMSTSVAKMSLGFCVWINSQNV